MMEAGTSARRAPVDPPPTPLAQLAYAAELARIQALRAAHAGVHDVAPGTRPVLRDLSPLGR
jgi:hypothetical protein